MSINTGIREGIYRSALVRSISRWLDVIPHPLLACEISPDHIAAAKWSRGAGLEAFAIESLPPGAVVPSAVETNILMVPEVRSVVGRVFARLRTKGQSVALLVPDAVVPIFVLHFDVFPRRRSEAEPLLRWRLKKSTPFEADETIISYMRQAPRDEGGVDIVTALGRLRIVREYEQLMESVGMQPGIVLSSTLAALPLVDDSRPALLARVAGKSLTTAIVRGGLLWNYRCIELSKDAFELSPQSLLDEIYPVTTYYQDSWNENIAMVRLAGLGQRTEEFREPLERELKCPAVPLLGSVANEGRWPSDQQPLAERDLDALVGWNMNRG